MRLRTADHHKAGPLCALNLSTFHAATRTKIEIQVQSFSFTLPQTAGKIHPQSRIKKIFIN
jgi:hypothetical protein